MPNEVAELLSCLACGQTKPPAEFALATKTKRGRQKWCRECTKAYRAKNAEHIKARRDAYYEANREDRIAAATRWYVNNTELKKERDRERRRLEDPELARERNRRWVAANRERKNAANRRREALKRAAFVEDVFPLVVLELDDGVCGICGEDVDPFDFHVDHVVPLVYGGEHSYANTQAAHPRCNLSKQADLPW